MPNFIKISKVQDILVDCGIKRALNDHAQTVATTRLHINTYNSFLDHKQIYGHFIKTGN